MIHKLRFMIQLERLNHDSRAINLNSGSGALCVTCSAWLLGYLISKLMNGTHQIPKDKRKISLHWTCTRENYDEPSAKCDEIVKSNPKRCPGACEQLRPKWDSSFWAGKGSLLRLHQTFEFLEPSLKYTNESFIFCIVSLLVKVQYMIERRRAKVFPVN